MKQVPLLRHFHTQSKRKWTSKADVLNVCGVVVAVDATMETYIRHVVEEHVKM